MARVKKKEDVSFDYRYGFAMPEKAVHKTRVGISEEVVREISRYKKESEWMERFRVNAYHTFRKKPLPEWGADLSGIDFDAITYFLRATEHQQQRWEDLPPEIKETYDRIGVPEAEKKFLAGVSAQYESEVVYESISRELTRQGVIFCDMDTALKKYPTIVKKYFGTLIPPSDNLFAALNSAVWSGGSFVYVPKGVHVAIPLQAYFRINAENMGQFERTLIIADEGSSVHYIEGCLPAGEQVSTGQRWVNIEAVRPGDTVLNSHGEAARVQAVRARPFRGDLITIQPLSRGNAFQVTPEHPVLAIPRDEALAPRAERQRHWLREASTSKLLAAEP